MKKGTQVSNRREQVLQKAMEVIVEEGLARLTMKRVAQKMGFSEPAMYRHFKDKQDLMRGMIHRVRERFFQIVDSADPTAPPRRFLEQTLCRLMKYLEEVNGVTILFLSDSTYNRDETLRKELLEWFQGMVERLSNYLEGAKARGETRPDLSVRGAALTIVGAIQCLTIRFIVGGGKLSITEPCKDVVEFLSLGVSG